ncbi:glycosyltransferase [Arthrobacter bambusae]|uniref:glycosyltransferase n=1 Tax=Arthrobacter bambusae TaxID=1338426 RepID=UPI002788E86B|nr:glycosyltransferase [Arthrobacter bambusae]MDQ0030189.1 glycosyltransferase involved in cell wall biosynthesis [Arthrobacter bambusae]MDQ0097871.1 glycosyltransferase involved in cell wall biosynthesis [Arthrobacter bambusae]
MNYAEEDSAPRTRVSVCMATFMGAKFIHEQLESILSQLSGDDEVVIVDDASTDDTVAKILALADPRIRLIRAKTNQGYVKSFGQAVLASRGRFIFLADQDDVWTAGRVDSMLTALTTSAVVASNFDVLNGGPRPSIPKLDSADSQRHLANLFGILVGYRAYYGCGMAFRRDILELFSPIPGYLRESHDLWLAIVGNVSGSITHLDRSTLLRRLHEDNATPRGWRSLRVILAARVVLIRLMLEARRRFLASQR